MSKPYSDMYNHNHFSDLEQEHSDFLYNLQISTAPGHKPNPDVPERKAWTVQYNGLSLTSWPERESNSGVIWWNRLKQTK